MKPRQFIVIVPFEAGEVDEHTAEDAARLFLNTCQHELSFQTEVYVADPDSLVKFKVGVVAA